jgi:hypothetical protein
VDIRLRNAARRAVWQKRTNKVEGEHTAGMNHRARRSRAPGAGSRPRCRLSRAATVPYIAKTATTPGKQATAVGDFVEEPVSTAPTVLHPRDRLSSGPGQIIFISGAHHVRTEWRQVQIQPGTQTEDRSAETHPRTAGTHSKGRQVSRHHRPRASTVGVGMITPGATAPRDESVSVGATLLGAMAKVRVASQQGKDRLNVVEESPAHRPAQSHKAHSIGLHMAEQRAG